MGDDRMEGGHNRVMVQNFLGKRKGSVKDRLGEAVEVVEVDDDDEDTVETFLETKKDMDFGSKLKKPRMGMVADMEQQKKTSAKARLFKGDKGTEEVVRRIIANSGAVDNKPSIKSRIGGGIRVEEGIKRTVSNMVDGRKSLTKTVSNLKISEVNSRASEDLRAGMKRKVTGEDLRVSMKRKVTGDKDIGSSIVRTVDNQDLRETMKRNVPDNDLRLNMKRSIPNANTDNIDNIKRTVSNSIRTEIVEEDMDDEDEEVDETDDFGGDRKVADRTAFSSKSVPDRDGSKSEGFDLRDRIRNDSTKIIIRVNQEKSDSEPEEAEDDRDEVVKAVKSSIVSKNNEELIRLKEKELTLKELMLEEKKSKEMEKLRMRDELLERERHRLREKEVLLEKENLKEKERLLEKEKLREERQRLREIDNIREIKRLKEQEERLKQEKKERLREERLREIARCKEKEDEIKDKERKDKEREKRRGERKENEEFKLLEEKEAKIQREKLKIKEEEENIRHEKQK